MLVFNSHKYTCLELMAGPGLLTEPQDKLPRALSDLPLLHKAPPQLAGIVQAPAVHIAPRICPRAESFLTVSLLKMLISRRPFLQREAAWQLAR